MKILNFFVLFVITENVTGSYISRVPTAYTVNDILGVVGAIENSTVSEEFSQILNVPYNVHRYDVKIKKKGTIRNKILNVKTQLIQLDKIFMRQSYIYIMLKIWEYCKLSSSMIKNKVTETETDVRQQIGFVDSQKNCMLTAFYDVKYNIHLIYESTLYFQTIHSDDTCPLSDLALKLNEYAERFFEALQYRGYRHHLPNTESADLLSRIQVVKQEITAFSNMFCSSWSPFVSRYSTETINTLHELPNDSLFIRNLFENEKFAIHLDTSGRPEERFIASWECDNILTKNPVCEQNSKSNGEPIERQNVEVYSLATLKRELKSKIYYGNFLEYYKIASEVMLLVSIREGYELLKGIRHVAETTCNNDEKEFTADEIYGLKSTLFLFKTYVDKLCFKILDKKRINITKNSHKMTFDEQVNALMKSLDVQENQIQKQQICSEILEKLGDITYNNDDHPININFKVNHLTEPLLNVTQLYHFIENDFL